MIGILNPLNWLRKLLDCIERPGYERTQRILRRNAEWCRQAQEAPPLSMQNRRSAG
jgi:hypothetical protein